MHQAWMDQVIVGVSPASLIPWRKHLVQAGLPCLDRNVQARARPNFIVAVDEQLLMVRCYFIVIDKAMGLSGRPLRQVAVPSKCIRRIVFCCASLLMVVLFYVDRFVTARTGAFLTQLLLLLDDICKFLLLV